jgi:dolichol-phosphate mannosyltransferase
MVDRPAEVWIVLPTYNEAENLPPMLAAIRSAVPDARILVVDDSSPDGTGELADGAAASDPHVTVLHRAGKDGLGAAYRAGFAHVLERTTADVVVQMDCDFSHDPGDVERLVNAIRTGADLAIGSRYVPGGSTPGWGIKRRAISRGGSLFARSVLGLPFRDLTGGFKAWRPDLLRAVSASDGYASGYGFQVEMTWRAARRRARIVELPIVFRDRVLGSSKMTARIAGEAFRTVIAMRVADLRGRRLRRPRPE